MNSPIKIWTKDTILKWEDILKMTKGTLKIIIKVLVIQKVNNLRSSGILTIKLAKIKKNS